MPKKMVVSIGLVAIIGLLWVTSTPPDSLPQPLLPIVPFQISTVNQSETGLAVAHQIFAIMYIVLFGLLSLLAALVCSIDRLLIHKS